MADPKIRYSVRVAKPATDCLWFYGTHLEYTPTGTLYIFDGDDVVALFPPGSFHWVSARILEESDKESR